MHPGVWGVDGGGWRGGLEQHWLRVYEALGSIPSTEKKGNTQAKMVSFITIRILKLLPVSQS